MSRNAPAAMLQARWPGSDVPGMTSTCGPRCRAHARRTCAGVTWCSRASGFLAGTGLAELDVEAVKPALQARCC